MMEEHTFYGRLQQGTELPLVLQALDADDEPATPDAYPVVDVYRDASPPVKVATAQLAADNQGFITGFFRLPLFLDARFTTEGRYLVVMKWVVGGDVLYRHGSFTLLPGGSSDGSVLSMFYNEGANARFVIFQTDAGLLIRGKNPR